MSVTQEDMQAAQAKTAEATAAELEASSNMAEAGGLDTEELTIGSSDGTGTNGNGEDILIADTDDSEKVAVFTSADFEDMSEEEVIAFMADGDDIRSSNTVEAGDYIIAMKEVRMEDINWVAKADADGRLRPVRPKNISFRYEIVYNLAKKEMMKDNGYQRYHTARKDGTAFDGGLTDYKRLVANAMAAAEAGIKDDDSITMERVLLLMDKTAKQQRAANKPVMKPFQLFNAKAASTDDNKIYLRCKIQLQKGKDGNPDQNVLSIGSLKTDKGLYQQLLNS